MIKTRLIKQLGSSSRYVLWQILCQWLALLGQIVFIFALARILSGQNSWPALLAGAAVQLLGQYAYNQASFQASAKVKEVLRQKIYAKLLLLGDSYKEAIKPAELVQLTGEGIESVDSYFSRYLSQFAYAFLAPLTLFAVLVKIDAPASIFLLCAVPLIPIVIMVVMLVAKKILSRYFAIYHQLADTFLEKMQGMTTLKVYQNDSAAEQELAKESEHFRQITMKVLTMQLLSTVVMDTVAYGGAAFGIVIALNNLRQGQVSRQGAIILILLAASYFLPMRQLGSYFHIGMNGMKASDQIFAFLDLPEKAAGQTSLPEKMDLAVSDLSFTYPDADQAALSQISLAIPAPGFTSIAGLSGSGKSTLAALLAGRLTPSQGQITLAGIPLSALSPSAWQKAVTLVTSDSYLFKGSVKDNLLMAGPASDSDLIAALTEVRLWDFLAKNSGLDYQLTAGATNLSGGQKQRLALARALLKDSQICIFDEATSNIDLESEAAIMAALHKLAQKKTVILISHRLANVTKSDRIYFLEKGRLSEKGKHEELLGKGGSYARLFKDQADLENYAKFGGKHEE